MYYIRYKPTITRALLIVRFYKTKLSDIPKIEHIRNSFIDSPTLSAEVAVVRLDSEQTIAVVSECSAPWQTVGMPAVNWPGMRAYWTIHCSGLWGWWDLLVDSFLRKKRKTMEVLK